MTFLAPGWLALLLLAAPILLLHMRRRRRVTVSSLLLWQGVAGLPRPSHALHKPPVSAALLLQLLALLLTALVMARPLLGNAGADHVILLLDAGAGQDDARFAATVAEAQRAVRAAAVSEGAVWSLVLVTEQPRPLAVRWPAASTTPADIGEALAAASGAPDWRQAALLAQRLAADGEPGDATGTTRILLIGPSAPGAELAREVLPQAELVAVPGGPTEAFAAARVTPSGGAWQVSGTVVGLPEPQDGAAARTVALGVAQLNGAGVTERSTTVEVVLEPTATGALAGDFDLALDLGPDTAPATLVLSLGENHASFVLHAEPATLRVLYHGPGNAPLVNALLALPFVELTRLPVTAGFPQDADAYDLVILDRVVVEETPATSTWWLGSARLTTDPEPEQLEAQRATTWTPHPLTAGVDWANLAFGTAWRVDALPGATVLVSGSAGPILQARTTSAGLELRLNSDIAASDWPATNSFPLFVRDLLELVRPNAGAFVEAPCFVGLECRLPAGTIGVTDPRGRASALGRLDYAGTELVAATFMPEVAGVNLLTGAHGVTRPLAVNAFQARVEPPATAATTAMRTPFDLRLALLVTLIGVLMAEAVVAVRAQAGARRAALLATRAAVLVLLGVAAAGVRLPLPTHSGRLVVVAPHAADVELAAMPEARLVSLGAQHSDLEAAVDVAAALVPPGTPARLVVAGAASETRGDVTRAGARTTGRGMSIDSLSLPLAAETDALVRSVTAPVSVLAGDRFELHAIVHLASGSTAAAHEWPASVSTYRDGELIDTQEVTLLPGDNRVSVEAMEAAAGAYYYEVAVTTAADAEPANDRYGTVVTVGRAPRVLLVAGAPDWAQVLVGALDTQGLQVSVVAPEVAPAAAHEFGAYGAVVLMNVPAVALTTQQQLALEAAVHDGGVTLLLLGGENAFGPGGYYETPLERLSPTSSLVPREAPELALAFVLDRSNSMRQYAGDQVRLDIAKVAALRANELLPEGARSSLIVFDSTARTLVPLGLAADDEEFRKAILELEPRGGTNLYPALVAAYEVLADAGAAQATVMVMSDGLSLPGDFEGVLALMRERNITVSTIAIGPEADGEQLREVARLGGGTFHSSVDFAALPSIMAHEVLLQAGELTEERNTVPAWHDRRAPFLRAWPDELPPVAGYVPTSVKPEATLHLSVTNDEGEVMPLLASWHHGAGEVVAFTSHAAGSWTSSWLGEDGYPQLWAHLLRQLAVALAEEGPVLHLTRDGDLLTVAATSPDVVLTDPDGTARALDARAVGQEGFVATALLDEVGDYLISAGGASATLSVPYPAVLDRGLVNPMLLPALARATGGRELASLADVGQVARWHWQRAPAWPWLTVAALMVLLLELTGRYAPDLLPRTRTRKD